MDYKDYNDYELLNYISENNEEAINIMYEKYKPLIYGIANKMLKTNKVSGLELNDLVQEGMLALSKAIDRFDESNETTFYTYAKTCIERKIMSQLITSNRLKRKILNDSVSIDATYTKEDINDIDYLFRSENSNPEKILLSEEKINDLMDIASDELTDFELQVFHLKINNFDYKEIADILEKTPKSIDNAIQRIKQKLKNKINIYN